MKIKIDYDKCCWKNGKCVSCGCGSGDCCDGCVEHCAVGAIVRKKIIKVDNSKCIGCGACVEACKHNAISLIE